MVDFLLIDHKAAAAAATSFIAIAIDFIFSIQINAVSCIYLILQMASKIFLKYKKIVWDILKIFLRKKFSNPIRLFWKVGRKGLRLLINSFYLLFFAIFIL